MAENGKPVLWHIPVSHYNEKARWALGWKGIEHERRAPPPPANMIVSGVLTRGASKTFPLLQIDGRAIGDSTEIIAALEQHQPDPPLYPDDPEERRRALALEEFFDEELGPYIRLYAWHELLRDGGMDAIAEATLPAAVRGFGPARVLAGTGAKIFVNLRYRVSDDERASEAKEKVLAAMDRLDAELGDNEYLVGDRFTVADLTAASLHAPLVLPPEGPSLEGDPPEALERLRDQLKDRPGYRYVEEMFRRHRQPAAVPA